MNVKLENILFKYTLLRITLFVNFIVFLIYVAMINTVTKLDPNSAWAVFLPPRWYPGVNDIPADYFHQWGGLFVILVVTTFYIFLHQSFLRKISYAKFILFAFFFTYLVTFSFVLMSSNSLNQYILQSKSVNNGVVYSIGHLLNLESFNNLGWVARIQYFFQVLGYNSADYTIPGTTHPPGFFIIFFAIAGLVKLLANTENLNILMVYWSLIVTAINCLLIPIVLLLIRQIFGEYFSRASLAYLLAIPSITFHICAMGEIIGSVLLLFGVYVILCLNEKLQVDNISRLKLFCIALVPSSVFVISAQISYSQIIPIICITIATIWSLRKSIRPVFLILSSAYLLPVVSYFVFEYVISAGKSFYPVRAVFVVNIIDSVLLNPIRPYPVSQIANWIIMAVYGGILFVPTLLLILLGRKKYYSLTGGSTLNDNLNLLFYATFLMSIALILSRTAHLEVERVWHWFFPFIWILSIPVLLNKSLPKSKFIGQRVLEVNIIPALQLLITVLLATYLIDYY